MGGRETISMRISCEVAPTITVTQTKTTKKLDVMKEIFKKLFKRTDNWSNDLTGLGVGSSRSNNTIFKSGARLDRYTLSEMYRTNGLAKRIVNVVVDDAMRGFIHGEEELIKELKRIKAKQVIFDTASFVFANIC